MISQPPDEMVDGRGGLRGHWRGVLGALSGLELAERGRRLDRAFEEEGITGWLPGAAAEQAWRCDPVPLPVPADEFAAIEAGLAQRARVFQAVLADLQGGRRLLAEGVLPPALVYGNPAYLRLGKGFGPPVLSFYAADLVRGADGRWLVLADRTGTASGIAHARENRRLLSRVVPELMRTVQVRQLRPFFDVWQDALRRLAPGGGAAGGTVALLTPGTRSRQWFEHMYLSRELSCALVEGGDLTVRGGGVFLKTLKGLVPVDVILSKVAGRLLDPLELEAGGHAGVPGLLSAMRAGRVAVANDPGAEALQAPGLAAFVPGLARHLLGEDALMAGVETLWLGAAGAREAVMQAPSSWLVRPASDGRGVPVLPGVLAADARAALWREVAARPWAWVAQAAVPGSVAPALEGAGLQPRPVVLRVFLAFDGAQWQAMQGGLAEVLPAGVLPGLRAAARGARLTKDVWVLREDNLDIVGPPVRLAPRLSLRRSSGDLPSRVADNLFWLGRYVERLDRAARLVRAALVRLGRGAAMLPREGLELAVLARSLEAAGLIDKEVMGSALPMTLGPALRESLREGGAVAGLFASVAALEASVRDRLTGDMHATITQALRAAREEAGQAAASGDLDRLGHAMAGLARFSTSVAGLAAENMVRGGGWLFLDLGRRLERAQAVTTEVGFAIDQPAARIEPGLRLALELCDSAITYRSRYFNVVQAAPVLDLVLADQGNPRGLAFQLVAMHEALDGLDDQDGEMPRERLGVAVAGLLAEVESVVGDVLEAADQAVAASGAAPRLARIADETASLSDRITRRYFALLPEARSVGVSVDVPEGAAA
jgi:uncharacterized circularly permuted ATP-grasp superfamily protein/uncharacterized alpha-E superfamily protein